MKSYNLLRIAALYRCLSLGIAFAPRSNVLHKNNQLHGSRDENNTPNEAFPVISKIAGIEWTGSCKYVGGDLVHVSNLKLSGGVKYDIDGTKLTLSSFITFPNGKTRQVVMEGERKDDEEKCLTMNPVDESGPIVMKVSEIGPDTILINEIEKASGRVIMTSSISIVETSKGLELVSVSHEVGDGGNDSIEGHQIWRMTGGPIQFDDF